MLDFGQSLSIVIFPAMFISMTMGKVSWYIPAQVRPVLVLTVCFLYMMKSLSPVTNVLCCRACVSRVRLFALELWFPLLKEG